MNYSPTTSLTQSSKNDYLAQAYISETLNKKDSRNLLDDYYDFPTLIPMKISPAPESFEKTLNDNCGALGHFFDWEKVKNIMNIHLSKPIA